MAARVVALFLLATPAVAQTSGPVFTPQQPFAREHGPPRGYVIQDPGRMPPVYVNPLPGGSYYINDLNRGPRDPVGPQPAPGVEDDED